jgi:hypothetical protein
MRIVVAVTLFLTACIFLACAGVAEKREQKREEEAKKKQDAKAAADAAIKTVDEKGQTTATVDGTIREIKPATAADKVRIAMGDRVVAYRLVVTLPGDGTDAFECFFIHTPGKGMTDFFLDGKEAKAEDLKTKMQVRVVAVLEKGKARVGVDEVPQSYLATAVHAYVKTERPAK